MTQPIESYKARLLGLQSQYMDFDNSLKTEPDLVRRHIAHEGRHRRLSILYEAAWGLSDESFGELKVFNNSLRFPYD